MTIVWKRPTKFVQNGESYFFLSFSEHIRKVENPKNCEKSVNHCNLTDTLHSTHCCTWTEPLSTAAGYWEHEWGADGQNLPGMDGALVGAWGRFPQLCLVASGLYCSLNQPWNEVCIVLLGESINQPWDEVWIRQNKVYTFFRFSKICNQGSQAVEPKWPNVNLNNFGPKPRRWHDFEIANMYIGLI
jgi:hypothetical protein